MSAEAFSLAASIIADRRQRPRASSANILCAICGQSISAGKCRPFRQSYGAFLPIGLRAPEIDGAVTNLPIDGCDCSDCNEARKQKKLTEGG